MKKRRCFKTSAGFLLILACVFSLISPLSGDSAVMTGAEGIGDISVTRNCVSMDLSPFDTEDLQDLRLIPGGMAFGTKFNTMGLSVTGFSEVETASGKCSPAKDAGIRKKDLLLSINGIALSDAQTLQEVLRNCGGEELLVTYRRAGVQYETKIQPAFSEIDGRYGIGLKLRDSGAGIGTVTFLLPDSGIFAGLGHGICDGDTGELIPVSDGVVSSVTIEGVKKGKAGEPGELKGYFNANATGLLLGNSKYGVWGVFTRNVPESSYEAMPVGLRDEIVEGEAEILTTLGTDGVGRYKISISSIDRSAQGSKCFRITVTDPELLERTGGIVQGMSGSTIIQNGKIIGAVTHVLVNEPTVGYGIFVENMLVNLPLASKTAVR